MCNLEFKDQQNFLLHCTGLRTHLSYTSTIGRLRYSNTTQIISYDSAVKLSYLLQPTEPILKTAKGSYSQIVLIATCRFAFLQHSHWNIFIWIIKCFPPPSHKPPLLSLLSCTYYSHTALHTHTHHCINRLVVLTAEWLPWLHGLLWL